MSSESGLAGADDRPGAVRHTQLVEDASYVVAHRLLIQQEVVRDLRVVDALRDELEHLAGISRPCGILAAVAPSGLAL